MTVAAFRAAAALNRLAGTLIATLLLSPALALASPPAPETSPWSGIAGTVFQQLTTARGLPNPLTLAVEEDGRGFLWVGTGDGLARWDGYRFRTYRSDSLPGSLRNSYVETLHADPAGRLWIGTSAGSVARYDPATDSFVTYEIDGSPHAEVSSIADDGANGIWAAGPFGLHHIDASAIADAASGQTPSSQPTQGEAAGLPAGRVLSLLHAADGALWAGTQHGLFRRPASGIAFSPITLATKGGTRPGSALSLLQDGDGSIWVGTAESGLFVMDAAGAQIRHVIDSAAATTASPALQTMNVQALVEARPGEIWAGTTGYGVVAVDAATLHTRHMRHDARLPTSLVDDTVWGLHRDRAGAVWAATARGLSRADPQQTTIFTVFGAADLAHGLSDSDITTLLAAPDNRVWAGYLHNGLDLLDPQAGRVASIRPGAAVPNAPAFPSAIVTGAAQAGGGDLFIATWRGLFHANGMGQDLSRIEVIQEQPMPGEAKKGPVAHAVAAIGVVRDTLWIAMADSLYSLELPKGGHSPASFGKPVLEKTDGRLSDPRVRVFAEAPNGRLWIGTWNGLNLLDPNTNRVEQIPLGQAGAESSLVVCLLTDAQHRLWVGTAGGGIEILDISQDGHATPVRQLTTGDGLPNDNINMLLADRNGTVWVSTDDGLASVDPHSLRTRTMHEADGVAIGSYYQNSGTVTSAGDLVFGGTGGLTIVRPDGIKPMPYEAPLVVTEIRVGGIAMPAGPFNTAPFQTAPLKTAPFKTAPLKTGRTAASVVVSPGGNSLAVEFAALDFTNLDRHRYAYRLEGLDREWIPSDPSRRLAAYTDLPPGHFTLRLRSMGPEGMGDDRTLSIPVHVLPAWYQTLWFTIVVGVAALMATLLIIRMSTGFLRRRARELEHVVAERTTELSQSNKALTSAAQTLRDLGNIGREITANMDVETVFSVFHRHLQTMLDAPYCAIYLIAETGEKLDLRFAVLDGEALEDHPRGLGDGDIYAARAARSRREIAIDGAAVLPPLSLNQIDVFRTQPFPPHSHLPRMQSLLCMPLIVTDRVIGVVGIQSRRAGAYGENEKLILRTISAYGAIALSNARTLAALGRVQSQLQKLAYSDGLTNLPNRRMYGERLDRHVLDARKQEKRFALLLVDLDRFKQVNDTYGHDAGDSLLVVAAARLKAALREEDFLTRLGGDEFAIILGSVDGSPSVRTACERVTSSFAEPVMWEGIAIETTVSIGAAAFPEDGSTAEELYKAADMAMYEAKRSGRNMWRIARRAAA